MKRAIAPGVSNYLEVLDAQGDAYTAARDALQVRRAWVSAVTQLYKALAGESTAAYNLKVATIK
ncbi:MAG: hypothetical protein HKM01_09585 [Gallionella sp.]|nr:hypothetical protein [Gallionella sp.]